MWSCQADGCSLLTIKLKDFSLSMLTPVVRAFSVVHCIFILVGSFISRTHTCSISMPYDGNIVHRLEDCYLLVIFKYLPKFEDLSFPFSKSNYKLWQMGRENVLPFDGHMIHKWEDCYLLVIFKHLRKFGVFFFNSQNVLFKLWQMCRANVCLSSIFNLKIMLSCY